MKTVEDGERIILLDKYIILQVEAHSFRSYFSIYCAGRITHHMYKCGSFVIQDIVMTFNMVTRPLTENFPCSLSYEGSLIACLILGKGPVNIYENTGPGNEKQPALRFIVAPYDGRTVITVGPDANLPVLYSHKY